MKRGKKQLSVKERITLATNNYLASADNWTTAAIIQQNTAIVVTELCNLANLELKPSHGNREPIPKKDETKENSKLEMEIVKETRNFM
jgi:hypothetical protein